MAEVVLELDSSVMVGGSDHASSSHDPFSPQVGSANKTLLTGQRADGIRYEFVLEDMPSVFGTRGGGEGGWFVKSNLPGDARHAGKPIFYLRISKHKVNRIISNYF